MSYKIIYLTAVVLSVQFVPNAYAGCDSCYLPRVNRDSSYSLGADREGFFVDFRYEYQDWKTQSTEGNEHAEPDDEQSEGEHHDEKSMTPISGDAESGDHGHNRSMERFYHFNAGVNISDSFSLLAHIPFVERFDKRDSSIENSNGFGDTNIIGNWRFLRREEGFVGALLGVKFPTGSTTERDSEGMRFEPELQPGTGSTDVTVGLNYQYKSEKLIFRGNALHIFRSEGAQDYQFGDASSFSLFIDTPLQESRELSSYVGLDTNLQYGEKDTQFDETVISSGGTILFVGPNLTVKFSDNALVSAAVLFPVVQERGGDHQDLSAVYTTGIRVFF